MSPSWLSLTERVPCELLPSAGGMNGYSQTTHLPVTILGKPACSAPTCDPGLPELRARWPRSPQRLRADLPSLLWAGRPWPVSLESFKGPQRDRHGQASAAPGACAFPVALYGDVVSIMHSSPVKGHNSAVSSTFIASCSCHHGQL